MKSVTPTRSGLRGGAHITILGESFSNEKHLINVMIGGIGCSVQLASLDMIVCALEPYSEAAAFAQGSLQPGSRGARRRLWFETSDGLGDDGFFAKDAFYSPTVDDVELSWLDMPYNANSNEAKYNLPEFSMGPRGMFDGFFRAPVAGNYTFIALADDHVKLWVSRDRESGFSHREELLYNYDWGGYRDFSREYYGRGRFSSPIALQTWSRRVRSKKVEMQQGEMLYLESMYISYYGGVSR